MHLGIVAAAAAVAVAFAGTPVCRAHALRRGRLDIPNDASSHVVPVPRNGGFAIVLGIVAGSAAAEAMTPTAVAPLVLCMLGVGALAAVDEIFPLSQITRFIVQIILAIIAVAVNHVAPTSLELPGITIPLGVIGALFAVVWLVAAINTFNFMDGLNGLASSAAIFSGCAIAGLGLAHSDITSIVAGAVMAGGAAGFLPWNLGGSIFMGDVGSTTLGFLVALSVLHLASIGVPFIAAALPLLSFVSDAFLAVARRAIRGERFFSTRHTSHFYQKLQQQGWSHAAVTALWSGLMLLATVVALAYEQLAPAAQVIAVAALALIHAAAFGTIAARRRASLRAS